MSKNGRFDTASVHRVGTARVKVAALRGIKGRRQFPFYGLIALSAPVDPWHILQQRLRVWMVRCGEELLVGRAFYDPAQVHNHDPIRDMVHHAKTMGYKDIRPIKILTQVHKKIEALRRDRHV